MCQWILASIRIILRKIEGGPFNITLIQVYALMTDSTNEDICTFYKDLDSAKNTCKSQDIVIEMEHLNAKVGMGWKDIIVGPYDLEAWNEKGDCL